jgi:hypothetical protein
MRTFLIGLLIFVVLVLLFLRRGNKQTTAPKKVERRTTTSSDDTAFHAVSIKFLPKACDAAKELDGKRILSADAPHIPLPGCDIVDCQCRFVHYKDRRGRVDRRSVFTTSGLSATTGKFEAERRHGDERREEEDDEDFF